MPTHALCGLVESLIPLTIAFAQWFDSGVPSTWKSALDTPLYVVAVYGTCIMSKYDGHVSEIGLDSDARFSQLTFTNCKHGSVTFLSM